MQYESSTYQAAAQTSRRNIFSLSSSLAQFSDVYILWVSFMRINILVLYTIHLIADPETSSQFCCPENVGVFRESRCVSENDNVFPRISMCFQKSRCFPRISMCFRKSQCVSENVAVFRESRSLVLPKISMFSQNPRAMCFQKSRCFPRISMFSRGEVTGNIEIRAGKKKTYCFPRDQ